MGIQIENRSFDFGATARDAPTWLDFLLWIPVHACSIHLSFLPPCISHQIHTSNAKSKQRPQIDGQIDSAVQKGHICTGASPWTPSGFLRA
jgi:hypothetical protein